MDSNADFKTLREEILKNKDFFLLNFIREDSLEDEEYTFSPKLGLDEEQSL